MLGRRVYRYCAADAHAIGNLQRRELNCHHPQATGNPFDFIVEEYGSVPDPVLDKPRFLKAMRAWGFPAAAYDAVVAEKHYEEYFDSLAGDMHGFNFESGFSGVASLAARPDNIGLWVNRAAAFSGFCLAFDAVLLAGDSARLLDVHYSDRPPVLDHLAAAIARDVSEFERNEGNEKDARAFFEMIRDLWQQAFSCKPRFWEHKQEVCLLVQAAEQGGAVLHTYPVKALREIVLGHAMPEHVRHEIQQIIADVYGDIPVRTATPAPYAYHVEIA